MGKKTRLPVSAACILQTPDRNANAKKVKGFLKFNEPATFNAIHSTHAESSKQSPDSPVCVAKEQTQAHNKPSRSKHSVTTSAASITLCNRFHGLSVEDAILDHSVSDMSPVPNLDKTNSTNNNLAQLPKNQTKNHTKCDNQVCIIETSVFPGKNSDHSEKTLKQIRNMCFL